MSSTKKRERERERNLSCSIDEIQGCTWNNRIYITHGPLEFEVAFPFVALKSQSNPKTLVAISRKCYACLSWSLNLIE